MITLTSEDILTDLERISNALNYAFMFGQVDSAHHKAWTIDQMVRALTGCPEVVVEESDSQGFSYSYTTQGESEEYKQWVKKHNNGEDGPDTYEWYEGIAP